MYFTDREKFDKITLIVFVLFILAFAFIVKGQVSGSFTARSSDIYTINNPSFVGEVIAKDSEIYQITATSIPVIFYRLHIVGEYLSDDKEIITFDRVFYVTRQIYNRYEVGDIISH